MRRLGAWLAAGCTVAAVAGCGGSTPYERFNRACEARHGFVADVGGTLPNRQCIVNNQIVYIPDKEYI